MTATDGDLGDDGEACPEGGCLDLGESPELEGALIVAFGTPQGEFEGGVAFDHQGRGLTGMSDGDGGGWLISWHGAELCLLSLEGRTLDVSGCQVITPPWADVAGVLDVVVLQADDDPADELLVLTEENGSGDAPLVLVQVVNGVFEPNAWPASWKATDYGGAAVADFDADGYDEVLLAGPYGDCGLGACEITTAWIEPDAVSVGEPLDFVGRAVAGRFDDDGIVDLMVGHRFYSGMGTALPTTGLHAEADYEVGRFATVGNFDADARDEMAMQEADGFGLGIVDAPITLAESDVTFVDTEGEGVRVGDLDGDGVDEVVTHGRLTTDVLGVRTVRFSPESSVVESFLCEGCYAAPGDGPASALRDLDGDGYLDYAVLVRRNQP